MINKLIHNNIYKSECLEIVGEINDDILKFNIDKYVDKLNENHAYDFHLISRLWIRIKIKNWENKIFKKLDLSDISSDPYIEFFKYAKLNYNDNESILTSELIHFISCMSLKPSQKSDYEKMIIGQNGMLFIPLPFNFNKKIYLPIKNQKISIELFGLSSDNIDNIGLMCEFIELEDKKMFYEIMENDNNKIIFEKYIFKNLKFSEINLQNMYTNHFYNDSDFDCDSELIDMIWVYRNNNKYENKCLYSLSIEYNNYYSGQKEANYFNCVKLNEQIQADGIYFYSLNNPNYFYWNDGILKKKSKIIIKQNLVSTAENIYQHIYFRTYKYVNLKSIPLTIENISIIDENEIILI